MARPVVLDSFSHFPHINTQLVHIYIACSRQVPARRPNQLAPEIVSISSEGLVSIASTRIRCRGGSAASENRVYLMDWVQSRPQGFTVHRLRRLTRQRMHITSPGSRSSCAARSIFTCHYEE